MSISRAKGLIVKMLLICTAGLLLGRIVIHDAVTTWRQDGKQRKAWHCCYTCVRFT